MPNAGFLGQNSNKSNRHKYSAEDFFFFFSSVTIYLKAPTFILYFSFQAFMPLQPTGLPVIITFPAQRPL